MNNESIKYNLDITGSVFHTVDRFKVDFTKCGQNLQEVEKHFNIKLFDHSENFIKCTYGLQKETLQHNTNKGDTTLKIDRLDYFIPGKTVLIYSITNNVYEFNSIKEISGNVIVLSKGLQNDYPEGANIVVIRQVEYKRHPFSQVLKRRIDNGRFLPVLSNVTGLSITHFEYSKNVFYRLEVNKNVQIRGYIFLANIE